MTSVTVATGPSLASMPPWPPGDRASDAPPFFPVPRLDKEGIVPCRSLSPLTLTCPIHFPHLLLLPHALSLFGRRGTATSPFKSPATKATPSESKPPPSSASSSSAAPCKESFREALVRHYHPRLRFTARRTPSSRKLPSPLRLFQLRHLVHQLRLAVLFLPAQGIGPGSPEPTPASATSSTSAELRRARSRHLRPSLPPSSAPTKLG